MKYFPAKTAFVVLLLPFSLGAWERGEVKFEMIEAKARELAENEYHVSDNMAMPAWMKDLTYDQYRDIRFRVEKSLWASDDLPFRAQFFHPGYLFRDSVVLNEFTDTHQQEVRFSQDFFSYGSRGRERQCWLRGLQVVYRFSWQWRDR